MECHYTPESGALKVSTAEGPVPYSFMACADQLYCVLCWRLVRRREVEGGEGVGEGDSVGEGEEGASIIRERVPMEGG